ncbi:MAG: hypothetical protein RLZZ381_1512 [Cyanobacteriota bacterium]|jgi:hypothetical protein
MDFDSLLGEVNKLEKKIRNINYRVNILYDVQWEEKVKNGYQKWRFEPDGGVKLVKEQLQKLGYKCPVCHAPLTEKSTTVDHLFPKSKYLGAAVDEGNMLIMCHSCNSAKNNEEFVAWYSKLPVVWRNRLDLAIEEIHGVTKLIELLPNSHNLKKVDSYNKNL